MINQQLIDYVNQSRRQGVTDEQIRQSLLSAGWSEQDIQAVINIENSKILNAPTVSENNQQLNQSAILYQYINKWSWGGFLLYFFYFLGNRNYKRAFLYLLGSAVPILNIFLWIKSGLRGRKLVWQSGKWQDFESYQERQKLLDKISMVWLLVLMVVIISSLAFGYFGPKNKTTETHLTNQTSQPGKVANQAPVQETAGPDIDRVKIILDDIRKGYLTGNNALIIKHASAETANFISSAKIIPVSSFTVNNVSQVGLNIVANITTISEEKTDTQNMVFIKEGED